LEYCERKGIIFEVSHVKNRDIEVSDLDMECIIENSFVLIRTGMIDRVAYGSREYFKEHPQLSQELIKALVSKHVSLIGIDMAGVRRGIEHAAADQFCADHGTYIIENLVNMKKVYSNLNKPFIVHTYPLNLSGYTGIPCRVIVEFDK
jgi:kynurenine formamidase